MVRDTVLYSIYTYYDTSCKARRSTGTVNDIYTLTLSDELYLNNRPILKSLKKNSFSSFNETCLSACRVYPLVLSKASSNVISLFIRNMGSSPSLSICPSGSIFLLRDVILWHDGYDSKEYGIVKE